MSDADKKKLKQSEQKKIMDQFRHSDNIASVFEKQRNYKNDVAMKTSFIVSHQKEDYAFKSSEIDVESLWSVQPEIKN
jgi:uncharacterized phage-like protein YoqJ